MKKYLILFLSIFVISNISGQDPLLQNDTSKIIKQKEDYIESYRQHRITIENMFLFENTSLNGGLFTSGNIDNYKQTISKELKETNVLAIENKFGISYTKSASNKKIGYSFGIYDRTDYVAKPLPVKIAKNVWIGERSIILKGTEIGENSIIGAGSVVSGKVPANVVYAGNPAKEIRKLDKEEFKTRESLFTESSTYLLDLLSIEENILKPNSFLGWIKSIFWPK